jgi:2-methylisocitrate lyase-like PEP mutase family enzyme
MTKLSQMQKAEEFQALHRSEGAFLMPNAWDAGSAILLAQAGFKAIGTTSAGIAFSKGLADYANNLSREDNLAAIRQISEAVDLPVSADTESGYGRRLQDVEKTMALTIEAGAVGASIEDYSGDRSLGLFDIEEAVDRVAAAVEAINSSDIPVVLTARAECFLCGHDTPLSESIKRLNRYLQAGAHCVFAPGPKDKDTIATLVNEVDGPLNVVVGLSSPALSVEELKNLGVKRISTGGSLARTSLGALRTSVTEILTSGTFSFAGQAIPDAELSSLFAKNRQR